MPIFKTHSTDRRVPMSKFEISRFTSASQNQVLYKNLAMASDSDQRGADNLIFDPQSMIKHAAIPQVSAADPSFQRFESLQMRPFYFYAGGFLLFLVTMKYLTSTTR